MPSDRQKMACSVCGQTGFWVAWVAHIGAYRCVRHLNEVEE